MRKMKIIMIIIYHERKETEGGEEEELGRKEDNKHIVVALPNELSNHNSRSIGNKAKYEKTEREKERKRDLTETYWPIGSTFKMTKTHLEQTGCGRARTVLN